LKNNKI